MAVNFYSFFRLLIEGKEIGALATEVEKVGTYGWDRFGRYKSFTRPAPANGKDATPSPEWLNALDCLAQVHIERLTTPAGQTFRIEQYLDLPAHPLHFYGWPESDLPALESMVGDQPPSPLAAVESTRENDLLTIGILLRVIRGEFKCRRNDFFESQNDLIGHIAERLRETSVRLGNRTLRQKFAEANRVLQAALPLGENDVIR